MRNSFTKNTSGMWFRVVPCSKKKWLEQEAKRQRRSKGSEKNANAFRDFRERWSEIWDDVWSFSLVSRVNQRVSTERVKSSSLMLKWRSAKNAPAKKKRYFWSEHQQDNDLSDSNPQGSSFQVIQHQPDVVKSTIRHPPDIVKSTIWHPAWRR